MQTKSNISFDEVKTFVAKLQELCDRTDDPHNDMRHTLAIMIHQTSLLQRELTDYTGT